MLALLIVGICERGRVSHNKLTSSYNDADWAQLSSLFRYFESKIYITPHILAEISNLCKGLPQGQQRHHFQELLSRLSNFNEESVTLDAFKGIECHVLTQYGYSDIGIVEASQKLDAVIMTADLGLCTYATIRKRPCINFANVRTHGILS